jgi:hypothetical protein
MCPACVPTAVVVMGSVMSTGGLTAFLVKIFRPPKSANRADTKTGVRQGGINGAQSGAVHRQD